MSKQSSEKKINSEIDSSKSTSVYSILENSLDEYFKQVKMNAMSYLQAVSDLQQEIITLRKNNMESMIKLQKTSSELKFNPNVSESVLNLVKNLSNQSNNAWNFQNHLLLMSIETLSKNIQAFNDNAKTFSDINQQILSSWASIIKQKYSKADKS